MLKVAVERSVRDLGLYTNNEGDIFLIHSIRGNNAEGVTLKSSDKWIKICGRFTTTSFNELMIFNGTITLSNS